MVVAELLRCYPSIRQVMNRISQKPSRLGNVGELPQGTSVGWNAYGVQTDTQVWGPTARDFIPERWGSSSGEILARMRKETAKDAFIAFNSHSRKCPGQDFALLQSVIRTGPTNQVACRSRLQDQMVSSKLARPR